MSDNSNALPNYKKLQDNKNAVLAFTKEISSNDIQIIDSKQKKQILDEARSVLDKQNVTIDDFSFAIKKMDQLKDAKLNIAWHESGDLGQGSKVIVRDARNVTSEIEDLKYDAGEKYAMQVLNEVRAAIKLLHTDAIDSSIITEQKQDIEKRLLDTAKYVLDEVVADGKSESLNSKSIKEINTYIISQLEAGGVDDAMVKLNFAKEVSNFKDEHRHIVTMTSAQDTEGQTKTVIEAEIMLNGLTNSQQDMYKKIADIGTKERGANIDINNANMAWYNNLPKYKREMICDVADDIASGNKVIPAQLIGDIPGLRNAYNKVTAIQDKSGAEPKIVMEAMHSGAPATKIKFVNSNKSDINKSDINKDFSKKEVVDLQAAIVQENITQIKSFVKKGDKINLNNLASKTPGNIRGEDFIDNQLKSNAKTNKDFNEDVSVASSPINRWRFVGGGGKDQNEFDKVLQNIGKDLASSSEDIKQNLQYTAKYLQNGDNRAREFASKITFGLIKTNYQRASHELKSLKLTSLEDNRVSGVVSRINNSELASILEDTVSVKKKINAFGTLPEEKNTNLEILAKMAIINESIRFGELGEIVSADTKNNHHTLVTFCKSGKDRTGLVMMETSYQAIAKELGINPDSEIGRLNKIKMAAGGHTQEMAGIQGGTIGCHSIKTSLEFKLGANNRIIDGIINQDSSGFNSRIKTVEKAKRYEVYRAVQSNIEAATQKRRSPEWKSAKWKSAKPELDKTIRKIKERQSSSNNRNDGSPIKDNNKNKKRDSNVRL